MKKETLGEWLSHWGKTTQKEYDPSQPRDENGMWTSGGGAMGKHGSFSKSGESISNVFHGSSQDIGEISLEKVGKRDAGFYGKGFYATTAPHYAKTYGETINKFEVSPKAKVLDVGTIHPEYEKQANPELQKIIENRFADKIKNSKRAQSLTGQAKDKFVQGYVDTIRPKSGAFDLHQWIGEIDSFADENKFDIVKWSEGEIVVKNPKVLKKVKP